LKLNGTHQVLVYADVNIFDRSVHTIKNTEALVAASKENGLKVMLIRLSMWSCLEIRMHDKVTE